VQRRDLVETDTESGTLSYANPRTVYDRLGGTITWLPAVGRVIRPGQTLYRVNGRPVVLFDGALPAYRALKAGDKDGRDILQLNRALVRLGFADGQITIDDAWQPGTTDAVKRWQASLGESQTGKIALGRIVFLPGAQRVTQVETMCGSTGGGSASNSGPGSGPTNGCGASQASVTTPASHPEFVELTASSTTAPTPTTTTPTTTTPTTTPTTPTPTTPATTPTTTTPTTMTPTTPAPTTPAPTTPAPTTPAPTTTSGSGNGSGTGSSGNASGSTNGSGRAGVSGSGRGSGSGGGSASGSGAQSASPILQTTSTRLVVMVDLDANKQSEAKAGERVTIELPAGNTVAGTISAVSSVADSSGSSGSGSGSGGGSGSGSGSSASTIPVTITLSGRHSGAGFDHASVSVNFAQAKAKNVLSVPVTALLSTGGGRYALQEASPPHKLIPVTTGLFAAGYVQISGAGIYPGLRVADSQG
jgi:hypothetical protein